MPLVIKYRLLKMESKCQKEFIITVLREQDSFQEQVTKHSMKFVKN